MSRLISRIWCLATLLLWTGGSIAAPPLPSLGVDSKVTVSGLSSGGYMAAQIAVAFSASVQGVAVVGGGPYDCAQGDVRLATTQCSCIGPPWCATPTPSAMARESADRARDQASTGQIDPIDGLRNQRVWLFSGGKDRTVPATNVRAIERFYLSQMQLPPARLRYRHLAAAGHGLPVPPEAGDAVDCPLSASPFLIDCGFDAAGSLLAWLYPGTMSKGSDEAGQLIEFDQRPYTSATGYPGLGDTGYLYLPDACRSAASRCRLHVAFHGCRQAREYVDDKGARFGDRFARDAGYNRWAAGSRIVVLYPQVRPVDTRAPWIQFAYNPRACWDFWGYTQPLPLISLQVTKMAPQMVSVRAMITALQR